MKKLLALLLVVVQVFALCACKESNNTEGNVTTMNTNAENSLRVGYARENVTPNYSIPLAGYGNSQDRISREVDYRLFATCLAISDENGFPVLLYHTDLPIPP